MAQKGLEEPKSFMIELLSLLNMVGRQAASTNAPDHYFEIFGQCYTHRLHLQATRLRLLRFIILLHYDANSVDFNFGK